MPLIGEEGSGRNDDQGLNFCHYNFKFVSYFDIRISDLMLTQNPKLKTQNRFSNAQNRFSNAQNCCNNRKSTIKSLNSCPPSPTSLKGPLPAGWASAWAKPTTSSLNWLKRASSKSNASKTHQIRFLTPGAWTKTPVQVKSEYRNPKSEIRNKFEYQNDKMTKTNTLKIRFFVIWTLVFLSLFRASDFGFLDRKNRVFGQAPSPQSNRQGSKAYSLKLWPQMTVGFCNPLLFF